MLTRRAFATAGLLAGLSPRAFAQAKPPWVVPDDAAIRKILAERIDTQKSGVAIVVGVVDASGRRIVGHGSRIKGQAAPVDGKTVFEIGSMTKSFTSLLLTEAARRGEVSIDDPLAKYLPDHVKVPERGGKPITLKDLATHTSGLPSLPPDFSPTDSENPYADFTVEQLYRFLGGYQLTNDIGSTFAYSNMGAGLLGIALSRRAGVDYGTLVAQRITRPLGMASTAIAVTPEMKARMAQPYDGSLQPTKLWDLPTLAGAGALRSDAEDVLTFLAAAAGLKPSPLKPAFDDMLKVRRPIRGPVEAAMGWMVRKGEAGDIVWHNGGTGGFRTFMGFDPVRRIGVAVLTNAATTRGGDDIGFHLLTGAPLAPAPPAIPVRTAITLPEGRLQGLVGRYQMAPGVEIAITRDGAHLFAQVTGQGRAEVYAESPTKFFWRIVDAQLTFEVGADGEATGLILHQNGRNVPGGRIKD